MNSYGSVDNMLEKNRDAGVQRSVRKLLHEKGK